MFFASDNGGPAHPKVMDALNAVNSGYQPSYGNDPIMDEVRQRIRDLFEAPDSAVYLTATGTACNALLLGTLAQPWEAIFCADVAHVEEDECGAPEFYTGGSKLSLVPTSDGRMSADALSAAIARYPRGVVHSVQPGPVTLTQITETGTAYNVQDLSALCKVARDHDLSVHMDGARLANAIAAQNVSPADMTWRAGVDALSFGGTKNGLLGVEAAVIFDPAKAWEFELRRKRAGHLFSKHRFLSAQMLAYLTDDLWLELARTSNTKAQRLLAGLHSAGIETLYSVGGNMIFAALPQKTHDRLSNAGAQYHAMGHVDSDRLRARLVCDWSIEDAEIDRFIAHL